MLRVFKINKTISKDYPAGSIVQLLCDLNGVPENEFWHQRYNDSQTDGCMTEQKPIARPEIKLETKVGRKKRTTKQKIKE